MVTYGDVTREVIDDDLDHVCVRAACTIAIPVEGYRIYQSLHSPGLWGIEIGSSEEYLEEVYQEELVTLLAMLRELGATKEES